MKTFLGKYWKQDVAKCNGEVKEKYKISRGMRRERGVAETNAGVANTPLLNHRFRRITLDSKRWGVVLSYKLNNIIADLNIVYPTVS